MGPTLYVETRSSGGKTGKKEVSGTHSALGRRTAALFIHPELPRGQPATDGRRIPVSLQEFFANSLCGVTGDPAAAAVRVKGRTADVPHYISYYANPERQRQQRRQQPSCQ